MTPSRSSDHDLDYLAAKMMRLIVDPLDGPEVALLYVENMVDTKDEPYRIRMLLERVEEFNRVAAIVFRTWLYDNKPEVYEAARISGMRIDVKTFKIVVD